MSMSANAAHVAPPKKLKRQAIHINSTLNTIFTLAFGAEVSATFYFIQRGSVGLGQIPPSTAATALVVCCLVTYATIELVKRASVASGRVLSRHVFPQDPLSKPRQMNKYRDQMWQLVIHVVMTVLEVYILFYENGTEPWWSNSWELWTPHPLEGQLHKMSVHVLYLLQMSIWVDTCFAHRFVEEHHKDYFLMYAHHLVTIGLVGLSYFANYQRIGVVVLFLHDISDIPLDLLKILNYCNLEGRRGLFLVELAYLSTCISWAACRLYLFPTKVIWQSAIVGGREVLTGPGMYRCIRDFDRVHGLHSRGHPPGWSPGDGSFDLWTNLQVLPTHECIPFYWESAIMLIMLQCMHVVWYGMLCRILVRMVTAENNSSRAHDAGREVYEGDSDDDDVATRRPKQE